MAGHVNIFDRAEERIDPSVSARLEGRRAAGMEAAAAGDVGGVGHFAG